MTLERDSESRPQSALLIWLTRICVGALLLGCLFSGMWFGFPNNIARRKIAVWHVRQLVANVSKRESVELSVERLIRYAESDSSFAATYALDAVGRLGAPVEPFVPRITSLISSKDPFVAREAVLALGDLGPVARDAIPKLIDQVKNGSPNVDVTWFSAEAIGKIGPVAESENVIQTLNSRKGTGSDQFDYYLESAIERLSQ